MPTLRTYTLVTALGIAGLSACGDDSSDTTSPIATIESQADALRDGDCEEALELTTDNNPDDITDCETQTGDGLDIEITGTEIVDETDNSAEVDVTYEIDSEPEERTINLTRNDDTWTID